MESRPAKQLDALLAAQAKSRKLEHVRAARRLRTWLRAYSKSARLPDIHGVNEIVLRRSLDFVHLLRSGDAEAESLFEALRNALR